MGKAQSVDDDDDGKWMMMMSGDSVGGPKNFRLIIHLIILFHLYFYYSH